MWSVLADVIEKRWKFGSLMIVAAGLFWIGWNGRDMTFAQLDKVFFTDAEAQGLELKFEKRIQGVEDSVKDLGAKVDSIDLTRIENELFKLRVDACMQPPGLLRASYEEQIAKLIGRWRVVTGNFTATPPIPSCGDLGQN